MTSLFRLSTILVGLLATSVGASDTQIRGFATLGATYHDSDELRLRRDLSYDSAKADRWSFATDSILGIQVDRKFSDQWSAAGQLVYKDRLEQTLNKSIEWAYLRYTPNSLPITIRAGRTGADVFMLSEYRNVGFAYLWARPPMEFYGPLAFDYIDGIDVGYSTFLNDTFFQARFALGQVENSFVEEALVIEASPAVTASFLWEVDHWKFHTGYASINVDKTPSYFQPLIEQLELYEALWPGAAEIKERLDIKGSKFTYYSVGAAYDSTNWIAHAELNRIETSGGVFTSSHSAYISIGHRFDDWTLYSIAAIAENTEAIYLSPAAPPPLEPLRAIAQDDFNSIGTDQRSFGIGARWDLSNNTALKMQWDRVWVKPFGAALWDTDTALSKKEKVDVISINLNFLF